jgi:putative hemolysin
MSSVLTEIIFIAVLILANGIFAMSEAAIISARKPRLQQRADEGDEKARAALQLANAPGNFLATVQIGITLVGILAGAFGGATIAHQLSIALQAIPFLAPYSESLSLLIVVLVITYFSLIVGELVPKNVALNNPEQVAAAVAKPMSVLSRVTAPVVYVLSASTNFMLRLIGIKPSEEPLVTEEEIKVMMAQGTQTGTFQQVESQMVGQVFRIGDLRASHMMTPRTELIWLDMADDPEIIQQKIAESGYSRYPVANKQLDNVVGIVRTKDVLIHLLRDKPFNLTTLLREPLFVPSTMAALNVLEALRKRGSHTALVVDEYGGLQGLVTLNALLQEVIRNDLEPSQYEEPQAVQREDGSWLLDGMMTVDRLKDLLGIKAFSNEDDGGSNTLGGLVMTQIDRVPKTGDKFTLQHFTFEVVDMDGYRVDKVLVGQAPTVPDAAENS